MNEQRDECLNPTLRGKYLTADCFCSACNDLREAMTGVRGVTLDELRDVLALGVLIGRSTLGRF